MNIADEKKDDLKEKLVHEIDEYFISPSYSRRLRSTGDSFWLSMILHIRITGVGVIEALIL